MHLSLQTLPYRRPRNVLLGDMCSRSHARLHSRNQDAEGGVGKSTKDFHGEYNRKKSSTPQRVEQHPTKGHAHHDIYLEDQGVARLARLNKRECRWWWDDANMPRRPRTTVRSDANRRSSKAEISLLLRDSIYVVGRRKPHADKEQRVGRPHALHALEQRKRTRTSERPIRPRTRWTRSNLRKLLPISVSRTLRKKGELPFRHGPTKRCQGSCGSCGEVLGTTIHGSSKD